MGSVFRHISCYIRCIVCIGITLGNPCRLTAQVPFTEEGQVFTMVHDEWRLSEVQIDPSNGAIFLQAIAPNPLPPLDALGYRRTDRMIYGIGINNQHLYRIDAQGMFEDLGTTSIDPNLEYLAGDITPDGRTFYVIGSSGGIDRKMFGIDLQTPGFPSTQIVMPGFTFIRDFAFDPGDPTRLYGYDANIRNVMYMNVVTLDIGGLDFIDSDYDIMSVFFNALGVLRGFGTSTFGVAGAIFEINKATGEIYASASGPVNRIVDMTAIPYNIEMQSSPSSRIGFPCDEIVYTMSIANRTGVGHSNINFNTTLPAGFLFKGVISNPFGGSVITPAPNQLEILSMQIPVGQNQFTFRVEIGDIQAGKYRMQGSLHNFPERYGGSTLSDDPITGAMKDSTTILINRIDEDSIILSRFMCLGEVLVLNGGDFGNEVTWSNGSTDPILEVTGAGVYTLNVDGGCHSTTVQYHVTAATCPFTIEVEHEMFPPETLPCSEAIFRFTFDNDSGTPRGGLLFTDTLPPGIDFLEILSNPLGGQLVEGMPSDIIHIKDMLLPLGKHVMDIRVSIGDIPPGEYANQALVQNFPSELGPRRWSDDPRTTQLDPTILVVLGVETDTLYVDEIICAGNDLLLDGTPYGIDHHWFNGSRDSTVIVESPGIYELVVFDGCEPTYIYFLVSLGEHIEVKFDSSLYHIHLGDSLLISPVILNSGSTLSVSWHDPLQNSLACDTCLQTLAYPRRTTEYEVFAENEHCIDSTLVKIDVDNTRILFVPNIFTPNHDGINDRLTIYSPDYGAIESFQIMDRWGNVLYSTNGVQLNDDAEGWDGDYQGKYVPAGTYVWYAQIRFLDDLVESFGGTVTLIR